MRVSQSINARPISRKLEHSLSALNADLFVVVVHGKILPPGNHLALPIARLLEHPWKHLLQLRARRPMGTDQRIRNHRYSMQLDEGMDTEPVALTNSLEINEHETASHDRLSALGAQNLIPRLRLLAEGQFSNLRNKKARHTHARPLTKADGLITWAQSAKTIYRKYQGMSPQPGCSVMGQTEQLKLIEIEPVWATWHAGDNYRDKQNRYDDRHG